MLYVGPDKAPLFIWSRVIRRIDRPRPLGVMVIVTPLRKMIGKFKAWEIGACIFEVDDNELLVLVLGVEEW
jgi:hypothetical protein